MTFVRVLILSLLAAGPLAAHEDGIMTPTSDKPTAAADTPACIAKPTEALFKNLVSKKDRPVDLLRAFTTEAAGLLDDELERFREIESRKKDPGAPAWMLAAVATSPEMALEKDVVDYAHDGGRQGRENGTAIPLEELKDRLKLAELKRFATKAQNEFSLDSFIQELTVALAAKEEKALEAAVGKLFVWATTYGIPANLIRALLHQPGLNAELSNKMRTFADKFAEIQARENLKQAMLKSPLKASATAALKGDKGDELLKMIREYQSLSVWDTGFKGSLEKLLEKINSYGRDLGISYLLPELLTTNHPNSNFCMVGGSGAAEKIKATINWFETRVAKEGATEKIPADVLTPEKTPLVQAALKKLQSAKPGSKEFDQAVHDLLKLLRSDKVSTTDVFDFVKKAMGDKFDGKRLAAIKSEFNSEASATQASAPLDLKLLGENTASFLDAIGRLKKAKTSAELTSITNEIFDLSKDKVNPETLRAHLTSDVNTDYDSERKAVIDRTARRRTALETLDPALKAEVLPKINTPANLGYLGDDGPVTPTWKSSAEGLVKHADAPTADTLRHLVNKGYFSPERGTALAEMLKTAPTRAMGPASAPANGTTMGANAGTMPPTGETTGNPSNGMPPEALSKNPNGHGSTGPETAGNTPADAVPPAPNYDLAKVKKALTACAGCHTDRMPQMDLSDDAALLRTRENINNSLKKFDRQTKLESMFEEAMGMDSSLDRSDLIALSEFLRDTADPTRAALGETAGGGATTPVVADAPGSLSESLAPILPAIGEAVKADSKYKPRLAQAEALLKELRSGPLAKMPAADAIKLLVGSLPPDSPLRTELWQFLAVAHAVAKDPETKKKLAGLAAMEELKPKVPKTSKDVALVTASMDGSQQEAAQQFTAAPVGENNQAILPPYTIVRATCPGQPKTYYYTTDANGKVNCNEGPILANQNFRGDLVGLPKEQVCHFEIVENKSVLKCNFYSDPSNRFKTVAEGRDKSNFLSPIVTGNEQGYAEAVLKGLGLDSFDGNNNKQYAAAKGGEFVVVDETTNNGVAYVQTKNDRGITSVNRYQLLDPASVLPAGSAKVEGLHFTREGSALRSWIVKDQKTGAVGILTDQARESARFENLATIFKRASSEMSEVSSRTPASGPAIALASSRSAVIPTGENTTDISALEGLLAAGLPSAAALEGAAVGLVSAPPTPDDNLSAEALQSFFTGAPVKTKPARPLPNSLIDSLASN